ncbi:MAG TPA: amidohydrolase family protein [Candidatus Dormibacteraeota bacterium]
MRAIDFHVHLPTPEWLDVTMKGYTEAAEKYFRSPVARKTVDQVAEEYRGLDMLALLLAWDAETATHRPRLSNEFVAGAVQAHPEVFIGFGSVDPLKGEEAVRGVEKIKGLGLKGVKLHPSIQKFAPDDERYWPVFAKCQELGLITLFHTGTSGIGAGMPGGQGIRLDYCRPIRLDTVAAEFPELQVIAAHFGAPWHEELLAIAVHKTNVHIDISGYAPHNIPESVQRAMRGRLQDQFLFGSDYPFIQPERCLEELAALGLPDQVMEKVLLSNGRRLLGLA